MKACAGPLVLRMRSRQIKRSLITPMVAVLAVAACGTGSTPGAGSVKVIGAWSGPDQASFMAVLAPFQQQTGIHVSYESTPDEDTVLTSRVAAGTPPDVALAPSARVLASLAKQGKVIALNNAVNMTALQDNYARIWIDLGQPLNDGKLYQVFSSVAMKGLIWYDPKNFQAKSYSVPNSWDNLLDLQTTIKNSATTPWCIALKSGPSSGAPGSDWIKEIVLSQSGPDLYDKWVAGTLKWTSPEITSAFTTWGKILGVNNGNVYGGTSSMLSTNVNDGGAPMFANPPNCYLHNQASFITTFFTSASSSPKPVTDFNFFPLPDINRQFTGAHVVTADAWSMFRDTPQARKLIQYLTTAQAQSIWVKRGGRVSPNKQTSVDAYPDLLSKEEAQILINTRIARFDAVDTMPQDMR
ncbi:MAG: ABC transporter substrate-binding protein, partial [Candidatus Dormibacteraeota bacterium]|nr:ABC transporter substrate-binding protein [Candidatus Dormibacteraeota bacterium]